MSDVEQEIEEIKQKIDQLTELVASREAEISYCGLNLLCDQAQVAGSKLSDLMYEGKLGQKGEEVKETVSNHPVLACFFSFLLGVTVFSLFGRRR